MEIGLRAYRWSSPEMTHTSNDVWGSGVMGSDGFESKKVGSARQAGAGPNRAWTRMKYSAGKPRRDPAMDALFFPVSEGYRRQPSVEISGVHQMVSNASQGFTASSSPDNGWPDVLLHVTVLRRDGYQTRVMERRPVLVVECRAADPKGYQAFRIVLDGLNPPRSNPAQNAAAAHPMSASPPTSGLERAQVKMVFKPAAWFFGFPDLRRGGPRPIFFSCIWRRCAAFGMTELTPRPIRAGCGSGPGSKGP